MSTAVYVRVSSEDQSDRGTIENQIEFANKYCDLHQFPIAQFYKDDGITGTLPIEERPEGLRLLQDAKNKKFDTLLVYKLDRLGRSARVVLNAVHELEQYGIKVKSMTEPFDTGDAAGRFLLTILAGVADLERSNILDRMWHGANRAARNGKWLGGIVPFGYEIVDGCLAINDKNINDFHMSEADVIRLIYKLTTEQHMSTIKIADYLNALRVPPSYSANGRRITRGKRKENTAGIWRPSRVGNIIKNTTYKGIHCYGKRTQKENREIITREVPAIVTEETWDSAQDVLKENYIIAMRSAKNLYLLRSLIKCSTCGSNYHGTTQHDKRVYECNGRTVYRGPLLGKCTGKTVNGEWLENLVWQDCVNFIMSPDTALTELNESLQESKNKQVSIDSEKNALMQSITFKEHEKQTILDLFRKNLITSKDVELQLNKIIDEKAILESRIHELETQLDNKDRIVQQYTNASELLDRLREMLQDGDPSWEVKREIVRTLVREIVVETKYPEDVDPQDKGSLRYMRAKPDVTVTVKYMFVKLLSTRTRIH